MLTPNFNFNGNCEAAMELYKEAFGGEITCLLRYSDADKNDYDKPLTDAEKNYVYHAEMFIKGNRVMMCDNMNIPFVKSTALSLVVTMDTKEEVVKAYDILKDGSEIIYQLHATTYSSCEVVLIDKFGFRWGIMTEQTDR